MGLAGFYILEPGVTDPDFDIQTRVLPTGLADGTTPSLRNTFHNIPLVLQDRLFNADGTFLLPNEPDAVLGDVQLVNGAVHTRFAVATRRYRLRILNGSNTRVYQLQLTPEGSNQPVPLMVIAHEQGLLPAPLTRTTILMAPAERREVVVDFSGFLGKRLILRKLLAGDAADPRRGVGGGQTDVMLFDVTRSETDNVGDPPATLFPLRAGKELFTVADATVTRDFEFDRSGGVWTVNGQPFDHGGRIDAFPRRDAVEIWRLRNSSGGWVHPIHMHDIPFLLLDRNEVPRTSPNSDETGLKDTFFLGGGDSVRVIGKFTNNKGTYVFHCHNIEHEDQFMMSQFQVTV
jgi:FtsP/CotA-like multicopper oxidase with cupredoxin domain